MDDETNEVIPTKPKKKAIDPKFYGHWRIVHMPAFDRETIDEEVPAFIEFTKDGMGEFQFVYVQGGIDCRYSMVEGKLRCDFSFLGVDENDDISGRGCATLNEDGTISGCFFLHQGDDYEFTAHREAGNGKSNAKSKSGKR